MEEENHKNNSASSVCLDFSSKHLKHFPKPVLQCPNLRMLCLDGNMLETLPDELFTTLKRLTWLDVRHNRIQMISPKIGEGQCLETLLIQDNCIQQLPKELGLIPNLKTLHLTNNPIIYPSPEILQLGICSIIQYLKAEYDSLNASESSDDLEDEPKPPIKRLKKRKSIKRVRRLQSSKDIEQVLSRTKASGDFKPKVKNSERYLPRPVMHRTWLRARERELRELWSNRLQTLLEQQASVLQRRKTIEALKEWRLQVDKFQKVSSTKVVNDPPFEIDEDLQMPSKLDLQISNSSGIEKPKKKMFKRKPVDLNQKINEIVKSIKALDILSKSMLSPLQEQKILEIEMKKLNHIQKTLGALKITNASTLQ